jgi:hypothetical protein
MGPRHRSSDRGETVSQATAQPQPPLTRDQALARVKALKAWSLVGSVAAFGAFGVLAALHVVGVTAHAAPSSTPIITPPQLGDPLGGGNGSGQGGFGFGPPSSAPPAVSTTFS